MTTITRTTRSAEANFWFTSSIQPPETVADQFFLLLTFERTIWLSVPTPNPPDHKAFAIWMT
jgi:hypothetical protein